MQAPQVAFSLRKSHLQESNQEHGYSDSALKAPALPEDAYSQRCVVLPSEPEKEATARA
jgi:hypothetical protein